MIDLTNLTKLSIFNMQTHISSARYIPDDRITRTFYPSAYACPVCGRTMYKTVCPIGDELLFKAEDNTEVVVKRMFTCNHCKLILFPIPGHKLEDTLSLYGLCLNKEDYDFFIRKITKVTTTDGRLDF